MRIDQLTKEVTLTEYEYKKLIMTNAEIIQAIRAEIERLYASPAPKHDPQCDYDDGFFTALSKMADCLDTLQEPKFNLDKLREVTVPLSDEEKEAHRKLMDERRKKYEEMGMLQEPKVDLEKALDEYYKQADFSPSEAIEYDTHKDIARHFYELGKGDRDTIFHKGMMYYRKRMMEEAVEAEISAKFPIVGRSLISVISKLKDFKYGDKVRIIILKE